MRPVDVDLSGRVALVTGANSGMGKETARELARMGAHVILGCRSRQRGELARQDIVDGTSAAAVTVMEIDLSSPASVRAFAAAFQERCATLDVLVNSAAASVPERAVTPEGFERHWATNVLGPYLLTTLVVPALRAGGHGRIVAVSTRAGGWPGPLQHPVRAAALPRRRGLPRVQAGGPDAEIPEAPRPRRAAARRHDSDGRADRAGASPPMSAR
jgi:NAD(P)-dependent dehydrogenase (short-subunit alcohol dehydrogenase family)